MNANARPVPVRRVVLVLGPSGGGIGAHVRMLARGLAARGVKVAVSAPAEVGRRFGLDAGQWPFGVVDIGDRPRPADARAVLRLRWLLASGDVMHAHGLRAGALSALAQAGLRRAMRVPLVVTIHNAPPSSGRVPVLLYRALEMIVARRADLVLCVSADLDDRMRAAGARHVGRAVVPAVHPRADDPPVDPPRKGETPSPFSPPGPSGRPVVLGVGRLATQKGFGTLLEAAATWRDMDPAPLVVIAGEGPLSGHLREWAASLGVDAAFLGHRADVPALLAAASVFVLPSLWEGQPLVLQEALRAGVPIVASRVGGIPDLAGATPATPIQGRAAEQEAAVLVRPGDVRELAAAVRAVLTDQALAARLRAAALRRAAGLPTEADAVDSVLESYVFVLCGAITPQSTNT